MNSLKNSGRWTVDSGQIKTKIVVLLIALPLLAFFIAEAFFSFNYFEHRRIPETYILPDDYEGWVIVEYENQNCPKLQKHEKYLIYNINAQGFFCTKSSPQKGWATNQYFYSSQQQTNLMQNPRTNMNHIWHEDYLAIPQPLYVFYVGKYQLKNERLAQEQKILTEKLNKLIVSNQSQHR